MQKRAKWLDRAIVQSPIYYTLLLDDASFRREMRRLKVPEAEIPPFVNPGADATTHFLIQGNTSRECAVVCIRAGQHSVEQVHAMLVHEAVHIWQHIRRRIGEHSPSDEFEAYSLQWLAQQLMYAYSETSKAKKTAKRR